MATFEQCQREYDAQTPDEPDYPPECPDCGTDMVRYKVGPNDGWVCNQCGYNEADYDPSNDYRDVEEGYDGILGEG